MDNINEIYVSQGYFGFFDRMDIVYKKPGLRARFLEYLTNQRKDIDIKSNSTYICAFTFNTAISTEKINDDKIIVYYAGTPSSEGGWDVFKLDKNKLKDAIKNKGENDRLNINANNINNFKEN